MTLALETSGLDKQFGGLKVTRDLSLRIEQGARHALIGPERRRQDHRHQSADRRAQAQWRPHPAGRQRHHRSAGACPRAARAVAHLPDQPALCRPDAARDHRACGVRAARPRRRLVAADGHARRRQRRDRRKPGALPSARRHERADRDACPTASSACWRSRSRSPPSRGCCCSTSPPPACPKASATTSWPRSPRCRATSPCC